MSEKEVSELVKMVQATDADGDGIVSVVRPRNGHCHTIDTYLALHCHHCRHTILVYCAARHCHANRTTSRHVCMCGGSRYGLSLIPSDSVCMGGAILYYGAVCRMSWRGS
jgi:hypothetical protein